MKHGVMVVVGLGLLLAACGPRFGYDPEDPGAVPVRTIADTAYDNRYKPPTRSLIPKTVPSGVLKRVERPQHPHLIGPSDPDKYREDPYYGGGTGGEAE